MPPAAAMFIADKIVEQAAQEGITLSEVERKMLLFSESSPTFPDVIEVNKIFDRDYDSNEYEAKVVGLIRHVKSSFRQNPDAVRIWNEAVKSLRGEDYYFMVLLNEAGCGERAPGDMIRLIGTAVAIVAVLVAIVFWFIR